LLSYNHWINGRTSVAKENSLYRASIVRLVVNSIIIGIIFAVIHNWAIPKLEYFLGHLELAKLIAWLIAIVLSFPFIFGMLRSFYPHTRVAIFFVWSLTFIETVLFSVMYFDAWIIGVSSFLIATIFFIAIFKYIDSAYQYLETQLIRNLNDTEK